MNTPCTKSESATKSTTIGIPSLWRNLYQREASPTPAAALTAEAKINERRSTKTLQGLFALKDIVPLCIVKYFAPLSGGDRFPLELRLPARLAIRQPSK